MKDYSHITTYTKVLYDSDKALVVVVAKGQRWLTMRSLVGDN